MKKKIDFQAGNQVYDIRYGWGIIHSIDNSPCTFPIRVLFDNHIIFYTFDGRDDNTKFSFLSLTEYTFEGFSQEHSKLIPKKGQIVWGKDIMTDEWKIGDFYGKRGKNYVIVLHPLTEQIYDVFKEITTENPYKDE
jgi:hypothetical protein